MKTKAHVDRNARNQGMNWIAQASRLAIYLRDGMACVYCGASVEDGTKLTLDHLTPHSKGGSNHPSNLVTCCHRCNSSRGNRTVRAFCKAVAEYVNHGVTFDAVEKHVRNTAKRSLTLHRIAAKELIASRGSVSKALQGAI
jgi:hypothetical protein